MVGRFRSPGVESREDVAVGTPGFPFDEPFVVAREDSGLPVCDPSEQELEQDLVTQEFLRNERADEESRAVRPAEEVHRPVVVATVGDRTEREGVVGPERPERAGRRRSELEPGKGLRQAVEGVVEFRGSVRPEKVTDRSVRPVMDLDPGSVGKHESGSRPGRPSVVLLVRRIGQDQLAVDGRARHDRDSAFGLICARPPVGRERWLPKRDRSPLGESRSPRSQSRSAMREVLGSGSCESTPRHVECVLA